MEYSCKVESPSKVQRKLTITVPHTEINSIVDRRLKELQRTAKIKGFRPGKVPLNIINQYYGEDVRHRAFHSAIQDSYSLALNEQKVRVVGQPNIETPGLHGNHLHEGQDLTFTATVEVLPEIEVKNYKGVPLKKVEVDVKDKEVDEVLKQYRESQAQLVPTNEDRAVKRGDFVDTDFKGGLFVDGNYQERKEMCGNHVIEVGSNSMIPGFEEELIGLKPSMDKTFKITFPKEYNSAEFAGQEAQFWVKVNEIKKKELPELNDELAKQIGAEDLKDLKEKTLKNLEKRKQQDAEEAMRNEVLKYLVDKNSLEVPKQLVLAQAQRLVQEYNDIMKQQGMDPQSIQQMLQKEEKNLLSRAEGQVKAALLLEAVADAESIAVKDEEVDLEISRMAKSMQMKEQEVRKFYDENPDRKENLIYKMREDKTMKFLLDQAKVK